MSTRPLLWERGDEATFAIVGGIEGQGHRDRDIGTVSALPIIVKQNSPR